MRYANTTEYDLATEEGNPTIWDNTDEPGGR